MRPGQTAPVFLSAGFRRKSAHSAHFNEAGADCPGIPCREIPIEGSDKGLQ